MSLSILNQEKLKHKYREEIRLIKLAIKEEGAASIGILQSKYGWCYSKADNAMYVCDLLGELVKEAPVS